MTVDNVLYLWNYNKPEEPYVYDGISEVIVSVSLTAPKPGIFLESVRYLLVVATPVDISVLAVCADEGFETIRLSPTSYTLPSDNTTMVKIVGSQCGRIFMAGSDFNIYELEYSLSENPWSSVFGGEAVRKCRKVNHFTANWKLEHIVPPLLRPFLIKEDSFADLVVDNTRNIMYGISIRGCLNAFYLGVSGTKSTLFANAFDLFGETRAYLNNSPYAPEDLKRYFSEDLVANGFTVLNIFPTSQLESKRVHAVVVLVNGTRIYLSLQGTRGFFEPDLDYQHGPTGVSVVGIRAPPPSEAVTQAKAVQGNGSEQGYLPTFDSARKLNVTTAFYARGTCFLSLEKAQQPDELLTLFEDHIIRSSTAPVVPYPSLREGLSVESCAFAGHGFNGKVFDIKELTPNASDPDFSRLLSLFHHSLTPQDSLISERSHHRRGGLDMGEAAPAGASTWFSKPDPTKVLPPFSSIAPTDAILSPSLLSAVSGFELGNSMNGTVLSELSWQHMAASLFYTKRQFAVLVNDGIMIFSKLRPADLLRDSLLRVDQGQLFNRLFEAYGEKEAAKMCLGLLVGLPGDAGSNVFPESIVNGRPLSLDRNIVENVLNLLVSQLTKPSYRSMIAPIGIETDSRVVAARAASDFTKSTFHDALYSVAGRLLRPIWLRVVVEGGALAPYWTVGLVESVRRSVERLQMLVLQKYRAVIEADGKTRTRPDSIFFHEDGTVRSQTVLQSEKQLALQAKALDDESIRNLYMLLSRSSQLLSLIHIFLTAGRGGLPFNLSALNGFTFRSVAVVAKVQEQTKKCIGDLINKLIASRDLHLWEKVTRALSESCYHFFSLGDIYTVEATKLFEDVRVQSAEGQSSEKVNVLMQQCAEKFKMAAVYWNSPEYIVGDGAELKRACSWLVHLQEWGRRAIVGVCLTAAQNFASDPLRRGQQQVVEQRRWDLNIYHGGSVATEDVRRRCLLECYRCLAAAITSYGSSQALVGGGILDSSSTSLSLSLSPEKSGEHVQEMIENAVSHCQDGDFHRELYGSLLERRSEALLRVNSPFIEEFLRDRDPNLLYKYYMVGPQANRPPKFDKAAELMVTLAEETGERSIEERIDCLHRALESTKQVSTHLLSPLAAKTNARSADLFRANEARSRELADKIEVADYQKEIRDKLKRKFDTYDFHSTRNQYDEAQGERLQLLEQRIFELSNSLVDISTLFACCSDFFVWDFNLLLLYAARTNDAARINMFWRSFLYRYGRRVSVTL